MPLLKLDVDPETCGRLVDQPATERRPVTWQAAVTLRRALGLPFPDEGGADDADGPAAGADR